MSIGVLRALPILREMDKAGVSNWKASGWISLGLMVFHLLLFVAGYITAPDQLPEGATPGEVLWLYVILGLSTCFHLSFTYALVRFLQSRTEAQLAFVEEVEKYRSSVEIPTIVLISFPLAICFGFILAIEIFVGGYVIEWSGLLISGFLLIVFPLNLIAGSFNILSVYSSIRYSYRVASDVPVNLYRLSSYGCLAEPIVFLVGAFSIILSFLGTLFLLVSDTSSIKPALELMLVLIAMIATPLLIAAVTPILVLQRRIEKNIQTSRMEVVNLLEGDGKSIADKTGTLSADSEAGLLARLGYIDSLSSWPVGSQLKRFVLFVLLPPFTWAMAAMLEFLMFSG